MAFIMFRNKKTKHSGQYNWTHYISKIEQKIGSRVSYHREYSLKLKITEIYENIVHQQTQLTLAIWKLSTLLTFGQQLAETDATTANNTMRNILTN